MAHKGYTEHESAALDSLPPGRGERLVSVAHSLRHCECWADFVAHRRELLKALGINTDDFARRIWT